MGKVLLLLTVSGSSTSETVVDLHNYSKNRNEIILKYVNFIKKNIKTIN